MVDSLMLLDAIHLPLCRPEYAPLPDGTTHCNQFVDEVATAMGYRGFHGIVANQIIDMMAANGDHWSVINMEQAQDMANGGTLIIAGMKADPHGHVCVVCPGKPKTSGRWGVVPSVANVGAQVFIGRGVNWAFGVMPTFYVLRSTL